MLTAHKLCWATFSGELSISALGNVHDQFLAHPGYSDDLDELLDFRDTAIMELDQRQISGIREFMKSQESRHHNRSALIVTSKLAYGLGRMLGANLEIDVPMERGVFYSPREALTWLRPGEEDAVQLAWEQQEAQSGT